MAKVSVQMQGIKKFERTVNRFQRKKIREVKRIVADTADMIKNQLQSLMPVDDGNMKQSVEIRHYNRGLSAEIRIGADYALYVNYGTGIYAKNNDGRKDGWVYYSNKLGRFVYTVGQRPQQFWEPSIEAGAQYFEREMNRIGA